jgi:TniQ
MRSWIGRVAARYDLSTAMLVAGLRDGDGVSAARLTSMDRRPDPDLEHLLATAARLDVGRIGALRAAMGGMSTSAVSYSYRDTISWCQACVCEDVARHGESYERAAWRLGCCAVCVTHEKVLAQICPMCACGDVGFRPLGGRWRLMCEFCKGQIDAPAGYWPETASGISPIRLFGFLVDPRWISLAFELQSDLLAAIAGNESAGARRAGMPAVRFVAMVHDIAAAFLRAGGPEPTLQQRHGVIAMGRADAFSAQKPAADFEMLGLIASVLSSVGSQRASARRAGRSQRFRSDLTIMDLPWFVGMLSHKDRQWLRFAAQEWSPTLARALERAVQFDAARRQQVNQIRDKARRDAAWAEKPRHGCERRP